MAQLDTLDVVVLLVLLVSTVAYFTKGTYWAKAEDPYAVSNAHAGAAAKSNVGSRSVVDKMQDSGKNCVLFYGSQTGTAEDYAQRLAKEGASRFGLKTMTADLEDYEYDNLDTFPDDCVAFFIMATYGEGEPTDNAVEFYNFLTDDDAAYSSGSSAADRPLTKMRYVTFGLGNNTYEHYNSMVRNTDKYLTKLGATRIGVAGEGDDGAGTMEEDFLAWKDPMWADLAKAMNLEEREAVWEPTYEITEKSDLTTADEKVYLGEPNKQHLQGTSRGPYNGTNPYIAPIVKSKELFTDKTRNCLHMEIDVSGSNLSYLTGDHIAIWPNNAGREVERLLDILDLSHKATTVIHIKSLDSTAKVPFPVPTTYDTILRFHLEICAPVSRQFVHSLAAFAPNDAIKEQMVKIGTDKAEFQKHVSSKNLNIAQFLGIMSNGEKWSSIPFSIVIESLNKLQPRYYSISSSSLVSKKTISITAVVESIEREGAPHILKGVTTNYLLALKQEQEGIQNPDPHGLNYAIKGPRNKYDGIHVPVHIRHSNFRLPSDPATPIIMIGPGTGVAPFRGFVQERAELVKKGKDVGKTVLFFGCRNPDQDFIYKDEWEEYKSTLGDKFELITAFSRTQAKKVYVQDRMKEHAKDINEILQNKGYIYVCGDASQMAREVNTIIGQIIAKERGLPDTKGEEIVKSMRAANTYQEDVWS